MHFVLNPTGSFGDVNPFLGIARGLVARGHEVTVVTAEPFRQAAETTGATFVSQQSEADLEPMISNPDIWHPVRGLKALFAHLEPVLDQGMNALNEAVRADSFLVGHTISFHARIHEEMHGTPAATINLAPSAFRSNHVHPALAPGLDGRYLPGFVMRAFWWGIDRFVLDPAIAPQLNRWRARNGLPPVRRLFQRWMNSPQGSIGLFPEWFGGRQPDWPEHLKLTTFPLHDHERPWEPGGHLLRFLEEGDPPVLFAYGSWNQHGTAFFEKAIRAAEITGQRAILQTKYREALPRDLPSHVHAVEYAPFSKLLHRCAAIVHHGGIGTSAQGIAAGIPQVIIPMGFDQPDNAHHLVKLGVAVHLWQNLFSANRLASRLTRLQTVPSYQQRCRQWRDTLREMDPLAATLDHLERLASS